MLAHLLIVLTAIRPWLKRVLPAALHHTAGRLGRSAIRRLEQYSTCDARPDWHRLKLPGARVDGGERPLVFVTRGLQAGGAERQLVNLLRGLSNLKGEPPLVLLDLARPEGQAQAFFARQLEGSRVQMHRVQLEKSALSQLRHACGKEEAEQFHASLSWAPRDFRTDVIGLTSQLLQLRPAVVHGWQDAPGLAAAIAGLAAGVPRVIVSTRNVNPAHFEHFRPYMHTAYARLASEPRVILTNNSEAGARDYERWLGIEPGRFEVIRNGIDDGVAARCVEPARGRVLRANLGLPPDAPVVGGIFRLQSEKRPLLWLRTAALVLARRPDAYFVIFGAGTLEHRMRTLTAQLGLGNRLVLAGSTADPFAALSIFDVLLLTSSQEGTPNVVLEAGLSGVPVVATDVGGAAEALLAGITGLLVPDETERERADDGLARRIADTVIEALESRVLQQSARDEGPRFVRDVYGLQRMVAETQDLYQRPALDQVRRCPTGLDA